MEDEKHTHRLKYVKEDALIIINEILERGNDVKIKKSREEVTILEITASRKAKYTIKTL
jgi:hypothetical protein|nr:MAG TPA: hypothetical protein [Caudoviricetes sp.]